MRITVAIPCYNGSQYVSQTIESILSQSRSADEVLVIDDGSTDDSVKIIQRYPVKLVQHKVNRGLAEARNTAIDEAQGDVLVFIDVDAFADQRLIETLLHPYADPQIGGVGGRGIESNIQSIADRWRRAHAEQSHGKRSKDVPFLFGLCMSYRLEILKKVSGFNPLFTTNAEDVDLGLRVNAAGYSLRYLPEAKVYHQRTDSLDSLERAMMRWYESGYYATRVNHAQPWKLFAGTLRRVVMDSLRDILVFRDPALVPLSIKLNLLKLKTLTRSALNYKEVL
jgi:O-antigen biosynthesis protein